MTTTTLSMHGGTRLPGSTSVVPASQSGDGDRGTPELTRELVLERYDPAFAGTTTDLRRGTYLADLIYSLDDPWRSRFVDLVERRAGGARCGDALSAAERLASRTQLAIWLADQSLARMVRLMLKTWMNNA